MCSSDLEPTPRDIVGAHDADLILWNGLNLELWFEQFLRNLGDLPSATLSEGIDPIAIAKGAYEGKANPHAWMGLDNAQVYVDNIAAALSESRDALEEVIEPFLLQQGLIQRTPRGRMLAAKAWPHMGLQAPQRAEPGAGQGTLFGGDGK